MYIAGLDSLPLLHCCFFFYGTGEPDSGPGLKFLKPFLLPELATKKNSRVVATIIRKCCVTTRLAIGVCTVCVCVCVYIVLVSPCPLSPGEIVSELFGLQPESQGCNRAPAPPPSPQLPSQRPRWLFHEHVLNAHAEKKTSHGHHRPIYGAGGIVGKRRTFKIRLLIKAPRKCFFFFEANAVRQRRHPDLPIEIILHF